MEFQSPLLGQRLEVVVDAISKELDDTILETQYFAFIDRKSLRDKSALLVQINKPKDSDQPR